MLVGEQNKIKERTNEPATMPTDVTHWKQQSLVGAQASRPDRPGAQVAICPPSTPAVTSLGPRGARATSYLDPAGGMSGKYSSTKNY